MAFLSPKKYKDIFLVFIWMLLIFYLSAQCGDDSGDLSGGITAFFIGMIQKIVPFLSFDVIHHFIRKAAHFTEYLILGILVGRLSSLKAKRAFFYSLLFCILYALSDELHQYFVPGRGPALKDVLIDSMGAFIGLIVYRIYRKKN